MAHFAQIDENNIVLQVLVVPDEQQHRGQEYMANDLMLGGRWIQTSYNSNIRGMFAGVGYIYNEDLDIFMPPKPYPSWTIDLELGHWVAPLERPEEVEGKVNIWNEETLSWEEEDLPTAILP